MRSVYTEHMRNGKCCRKPTLVRGWVGPRPLGRALFCRHCGESLSDMSTFGEFIWYWLYARWFWNGMIRIPNDGEREVNL